MIPINNWLRGLLPLILCAVLTPFALAQVETDNDNNETLDSMYIAEVEKKEGPVKVLHAEPLYIDLIRDLGARKGEKEWNFGVGLADNLKFDSYEALVEYEFAPINRLGFEVELPFTFYTPQNGYPRDSVPSNRLESIKLATQWTFFVSEKMATSMALGYIHEFAISDFRNFGNPLFQGNAYNPFFIAAKRWGNNFHTLLYTGPVFHKSLDGAKAIMDFQINSNIHYMISGTRNFIGIEFNKEISDKGEFVMTMRPQMRVGISDNFLVGIVGGIPVNRTNERLSMFLRLIWEPH